ncbi:MAG: hypothetical protein LBP55_03695 [Candidatus Adiutrix sp.]|jgi:hypothetical protein|nr:hypothetical protein [Candidatus Adiutrix sp.]
MSARIFLALDDTDVKYGDFGTGKVARLLAEKLPEPYHCWGVLRHQLPRLKEIPFTSHNSPSCLTIDCDGSPDLALLTRLAREHVSGMASPGSDPGICLALDGPHLDGLTAFGREASHRLVTQAEARAAATAAGAVLEGLGGTNDGIIGAAAAVGLSHHGWYGRLSEYHVPLKELPNPVRAGYLREIGIKVISLDRQAFIPMDDDLVETYNRVRPYLWGGEAVLPVLPCGDPADLKGRWRVAHSRPILKKMVKPVLRPVLKFVRQKFMSPPPHPGGGLGGGGGTGGGNGTGRHS